MKSTKQETKSNRYNLVEEKSSSMEKQKP